MHPKIQNSKARQLIQGHHQPTPSIKRKGKAEGIAIAKLVFPKHDAVGTKPNSSLHKLLFLSVVAVCPGV